MRKLTLLSLIGTFALSMAASDARAANKARVKLVPSVETVASGGSFDVAIHFDIDEDWHIYWQNSGDSGQAPRVKWNLADGVEAGPLRYPVPKRHHSPGDIVTNILEGTPSLLSRIGVGEDIEEGELKLEAALRYLVCDETCLLENADLRATVTIGAPGSPTVKANEDLFRAARRKLPKKRSDRVSVSGRIEPADFKPGDEIKLVATVNIASGYHIQNNEPELDVLYPADLYVKQVDDVYWERPQFPKAKKRTVKGLGDLLEYEGKIEVSVPGEVDAEAEGPYPFGGVFVFQACDNAGRCDPPDAVEFDIKAGPAVSSAKPAGTEAVAATSDEQNAASDDVAEGDEGSDDEAASALVGTSSDEADESSAVAAGNGGLQRSFLTWLGFAFLGGLILNVMPCVLPVISIKVLSFVQQAGENRMRVLKLGLTFCLGIMVSFWALAGSIIAVKAVSGPVGWGFQFQSPVFVLAMITLIFVFGLSLLGVFEFTLPGAAVSSLSVAQEREGYLGAFMKGVLGTILATPCTAPFLGSALGFAFSRPSGELLLIFTAIGLGMASPFALLSAMPGWLKLLPKPGMWMEHFKQLMGFLLMGTVVWLMFTLVDQLGGEGILRAVGFLVVVALACWLLGLQTPSTPAPKRVAAWLLAISLGAGSWAFAFSGESSIENLKAAVIASRVCPCADEQPEITQGDWDKKVPWQTWSKGRPEHLAQSGYTVYVDFTATWCATCQANKAATIDTDAMRNYMREHCIIPLRADYTLEDPDITEVLQRFERGGVPLNVIYPAGRPNEPIVLPEQLVGRSSLVREKIAAAGSSLVCPWDTPPMSSAIRTSSLID